MPITNTNVKFITKWLESKVRRAREDVERELLKIPNRTQNAFDRFVPEVPADDPYVFVISDFKKTTNKSTLKIECIGNQVLFIEFGAGITFYSTAETHLYKNVIPNDRPQEISDIGTYGQHRGKDDVWFYKSEVGRESENAHLIKYNTNGNPIMITHGNRPARALYRSVGIAMRNISSMTNKKIRRIAPPPLH